MSTLVTLVVWLILPLLFGAVVLALVRLLRGSSVPDRVVALDLMTIAGIGMIAVYAAATGQSMLLDVVMIVALLSFLGVVAIATYLQRSVERG
jgi:multicomponent Na+:H+ antiporter subunit F